jgi:hypothetical protein
VLPQHPLDEREKTGSVETWGIPWTNPPFWSVLADDDIFILLVI